MSNTNRRPGRPSQYPLEFQSDAVAMVLDEGRAIAYVARSIGGTKHARGLGRQGPQGTTSASLSSLRRRRFALIDLARDCTLRVRFENLVRDANPAAFNLATARAIRATPFANSDESDGYDTFASTTVVSARNRFVFNTLASCAFASRASFSASTACWPQRVVIFINVVECRHPTTQRDPTEPLPRDRVRHLPAQRLEPEPIPILQEHQPQIRLDRDRRPTMRGVEERHERSEEALIIEEPIDPIEFDGHHQRLGRQQRFPQRRLIAYRSQHRWLRSVVPVRVGAIEPHSRPQREPSHQDFFRAK
jgi:transposase-like protein